MIRKIMVFVVSLSMVLSLFTVKVGGSISDLEMKKQEIEKQIAEIRKQATALKNEKNSTQKQINALDAEIRALELEADGYELQKNELNIKISDSEQKIENLNKDIENNNMLLEERLRVMYKNGTAGYMEVILKSANLVEALTRADMIQLIVKSDVELLKEISEQKTTLEALKKVHESERADLSKVINDISSKQKEVETASISKEKYMKSIQKDMAEIQRQQAEMEAQSAKIEKEILAAQRAVAYAGGKLLWPVPGQYRVTSNFGGRADPITGLWSSHGGTDIAAPYGTPIVSSNDGVVIFSGWHYSYGYYVIVDHGGGIATLYGHCSKLLVTKGQAVTKGQTIALVGSTGYSTGNHLHFEVRVNGIRKQPMDYLK